MITFLLVLISIPVIAHLAYIGGLIVDEMDRKWRDSK